MTIQFSAQIDDIKALKDRTLRVKLDTQEMSSEDMSKLFDYLNEYKQIWVALADVPVKPEDIDIKEIKGDSDKTPSQRLRSRMFVYYKENFKKEEGFNDWYASALDKIGNQYLSKLD